MKRVFGNSLALSAVAWGMRSGCLSWEACKKLYWAARRHLALLLAQQNGQGNDMSSLPRTGCLQHVSCLAICSTHSKPAHASWLTQYQKCKLGNPFLYLDAQILCTACATTTDALIDACMRADATAPNHLVSSVGPKFRAYLLFSDSCHRLLSACRGGGALHRLSVCGAAAGLGC